jgi:hypothetical protein
VAPPQDFQSAAIRQPSVSSLMAQQLLKNVKLMRNQ